MNLHKLKLTFIPSSSPVLKWLNHRYWKNPMWQCAAIFYFKKAQPRRSLNSPQMNSTRMPFDGERFHFGKAWGWQLGQLGSGFDAVWSISGWNWSRVVLGPAGEVKLRWHYSLFLAHQQLHQSLTGQSSCLLMWQLTRKSMGLWCHQPFSPTCPGGPRGGLAVFQSLASKFMPSYRHFQHLPLAAIRRDFGGELQGWSSHGPCEQVPVQRLRFSCTSCGPFLQNDGPPNHQTNSSCLSSWIDRICICPQLGIYLHCIPLCVPVSKLDELVFFGGCSINLA